MLNPGESLLVVYPTDTATLVWLVGADGRKGFSAVAVSRAELARRVAQLRGLLDLGVAPAGRESVPASAQLYALYKDLLGSLEPALRDVRSLLIATDGPLASLPLAALVTQPPQAGQAPAWLVRQMAVSQLPSSSALLALRRVAQPTVAAKALMGFGDPLFGVAGGAKLATAPRVDSGLSGDAARYDAQWGFSYADMPALPDTRTELLALASALGANPKTDLLMGAQATRRAVLDANLLDRRVVAFATHGLMPGELPGISKPSLAMAATGDTRESPLLELDDVLGLRLNAQWVLLSACNTAAGEQGGAAMSGLVRGFFFAGARSVLATHWAVESESATALTSATFSAQGKGTLSRGESLRQAQLAMLDGKLGNGRWSHPFYWAPYALLATRCADSVALGIHVSCTRFSPARWAAGFLLLALSLLALGAHAQAVAVVTDVKGAVAFAPDRGTKPVALLSELTNGADIQLEKGATLSLVYLQSGTEFQLRGPARITWVRPRHSRLRARVPSCARRWWRPKPPALQTANGRVVLGGMVMRGLGMDRLKLLEPIGKVLGARPTFAWTLPPDATTVQFELRDEGSDKVLLSAAVQGSQLVLDDKLALQAGVNYVWTVALEVPGANSLVRSSYFSLSSPQERERMEALRPGPQAPFSDRLIFASLLEQGRFLSESRKLWQQLAEERPDLPELRTLAKR
ncbi:CHAT domain-containing protein [Candidatus Aalborgicola defluviihabitans]|uniref:CHAT domain-containing protein n=1 Tax=Candidatus Aalborgicola defluviihabitans TaxID=3386187 RepID=UPI001D89AB24|nr:CHAT domain-containing protein [Burkholderiales bacterium]